MKGYRFYLEYADAKAKRRKGAEHSGNVFALDLESKPRLVYHALGGWIQEGFGAVFYWANSPVTYCATSLERLRRECKRISEAEARRIHPALFERLDDTTEKKSNESKRQQATDRRKASEGSKAQGREQRA